MSSIINSQSSLFSNKSLIRYWKLSGADVFPKTSRLKQNLPNGVINVVNFAISECRGICQSPLDVSSLEKYRVWAVRVLRASLHCSAFLDRHRSLAYHYFSVLTDSLDYTSTPSAWAPLLFLALKEKLFFLLCWSDAIWLGLFLQLDPHWLTLEQTYISKQLSIRKYGNWSWPYLLARRQVMTRCPSQK